jgi:signal transduction histidine kinase
MTVSLALAIVFARSARSRAGRLLLVNRHLEAEIEERTRAVQALVEKQERLLQGERLAAIGQMVTGLAHESRNALQRGQACLEMLARRVAGVPRALELVDRIQCAQDDLQRLYEEVREYAAPLQLRREMHRLDVILERSWEKLALRREGREARLVQRGRELNLRSEVDAFLLERVFRNVLENSLEACEDPVEISADWSEAKLGSRAALRVSIRDNGPGVTAEKMQRIFEPFYTTKRKGTGLGLSIARRLVELHEGAIEARSGPGVEIVLILPREGQS